MRFLRRALPFALTAALPLGCLVTSDFGGIVGVRSEAGAESDGGEVDGNEASVGCAGGSHTLCTDFDDVTGLPVPGWTSAQKGGGTLTIDRALGVTTPNALAVAVKGETTESSAYLVRDAPLRTFSSLKFSFDFRIIECEAQVKNALTFVFLGVGSVAYGFVILSSGTLAIGAQSGTTNDFFPLDPQPPKGAWRHLALTLTQTTPTQMHLLMTMDGASAAEADTLAAAPKSTLTINLGVQGETAPIGCQVAYDNIVMDKE